MIDWAKRHPVLAALAFLLASVAWGFMRAAGSDAWLLVRAILGRE